MKRNKKSTLVKELADKLHLEFTQKLPVLILPNGDITYKDYVIRKGEYQKYEVLQPIDRKVVDSFYLKSCALMAAKYHNKLDFANLNMVRMLDLRYWSKHTDIEVFSKNLKSAKDLDKYMILLTRLEHSKEQADIYREEISRMFKWSFV